MKKLFIALLAVVALATSCSTAMKTINEPIAHFQLNSNDYVLSEQVVGQATVHRVLGIDWARLFTNKYGSVNAPLVGTVSIPSLDNMYAIYDLIEKNPGYDFVMYPQFTAQVDGVKGIYEKTTIKVVARLGKLKK